MPSLSPLPLSIVGCPACAQLAFILDRVKTLAPQHPDWRAERTYGIPPSQVIGSSIRSRYALQNGTPVLVRLPDVEIVDEKAGKPVGIQRSIGKRPVAAFGTSDGDLGMLEWVTSGRGPRFAGPQVDGGERQAGLGERLSVEPVIPSGGGRATMQRLRLGQVMGLALAAGVALAGPLVAQKDKGKAKPAAAAPAGPPNILVIWGDDIGYWNISAYNRGMMGYRTPNIDRIAKEGAIFTDAYGQQSCTAGRAAFITGQSPIRTGLLKVGLPGAKEGMPDADPTIATVLHSMGYMTAQFGKNHLGDRNEHFPTVHGFDEWMGNLYHLNAEEEPENEDYPKNPEFKAKFGPRGVFKCVATATETPGDDPRFGKWGKQKCVDTGPLTKKRMETIDEEVTTASLDFMDRAVKAKKPFFLWWNSTRMHIFTHLKESSKGKTGLGTYPDGMVEHDAMVGQLLKKLDDLGIAENTIVFYSTDNGAEVMSWPDGGTTPFRGEKNTNWEGGYRVPAMIRWPGLVKPGTEINDIVSHEDWLTTFVAAAGDTKIKEKLLAGTSIDGKTYKSHLDGYDMRDVLAGKAPSPRHEFIYWTDGGEIAGLRYDQWKLVFLEQRAESFDVWQEPLVPLRVPKLFTLRGDPFERGDHEGIDYAHWRMERIYLLVPAQAYVGQWIQSFRDFPPRQKPGTFSLDQVMEQLTTTKHD